MLHATLARTATTHSPSLSRGTLGRHLVTVLLVILMLVPAPGQHDVVDAKGRTHAARANQGHARPKASRSEKKSDRKAKQARAKKQKAKSNQQQARQQKRKHAAQRQENQPATATPQHDGGASRTNAKKHNKNKHNTKNHKNKKNTKASRKQDRREKAQQRRADQQAATEQAGAESALVAAPAETTQDPQTDAPAADLVPERAEVRQDEPIFPVQGADAGETAREVPQAETPERDRPTEAELASPETDKSDTAQDAEPARDRDDARDATEEQDAVTVVDDEVAPEAEADIPDARAAQLPEETQGRDANDTQADASAEPTTNDALPTVTPDADLSAHQSQSCRR
jgi:hypothetical protein